MVEDKVGLGDQVGRAVEGVEGAVEHACVGIVEAATHEADLLAPVEDVGHSDQYDALIGEHVGGLADQLLGRSQVLLDMGKHDAVVVVLPGLGRQAIFHIGHEAFTYDGARDFGFLVRDCNAVDLEPASRINRAVSPAPPPTSSTVRAPAGMSASSSGFPTLL